MKAFVVLDDGYINQAVVSLSSFFRYNRIELIIYAEKDTDLERVLAVVPEELVEVRTLPSLSMSFLPLWEVTD